MKSTIYIPKKINVGYREREDTYTGKLAYVIYWDEKGVLRKEKSWNGWRDEGIPNDEFGNIPTKGFVLNKHAGGVENSWGWNARKSYCRIYDPRGFEFEITIENLLYILENTSCIKGKGIEGELIYGWDGNNLVLIPIESPDYKEMVSYSNTVKENKMFSVKDMVIGGTYLTKNNEHWVYMGRFNAYSGLHYDLQPQGKHYWFYNGSCFSHQKTFPKNKIIDCLDDKCNDNYADLFYKMEGDYEYSPYDKTKDKIASYTIDGFRESFNYWGDGFFISKYLGEYKEYKVHKSKTGSGYVIYERIRRWSYKFCNIFPFETNEYGEKEMIPVSLDEIFEKMKPKYVQMYLQNGREYGEKGWLKDE